MDAVVFYPATDAEMKLINEFALQNKLTSFTIDEESKKRLAGIVLSKLSSQNPNAYATDEEIISVVEEVRQERYGKRS